MVFEVLRLEEVIRGENEGCEEAGLVFLIIDFVVFILVEF